MKNYILLGIGIGMILSGSIFTYIENKEYNDLEARIREEIKQEYAKERKYEELIEDEFKSYFEEEDKKEEVKVAENTAVKTKDSDVKEAAEKEEPAKEKAEEKTAVAAVEKESVKEVKEETKKAEVTVAEKKEEKPVLEKFEPIKGEKNVYTIQFRSGSKREDIESIKEELSGIIDTKIEFVQGYYRLFSEDLYSENHAKIIAHEIKQHFSLNPVVRSPKQMDYLILGPDKYNKKYNKEKPEEKAEAVSVEEEEKVEAVTQASIEEVDKTEVKKAPAGNAEKEEIKIAEEVKEAEKAVTEASIQVTSESAVKAEETVTGSAIGVTEEVVALKDIKLVFLEDGKKEELDSIKENIGDLIELEIENKNDKYTVKSKEIFTETVADDLVSKLKLLFDMDVKEEKVEVE